MNKFVIELKKGHSDQVQSHRNHQRSLTQPPETWVRSDRSAQLYRYINELSPYSVHNQDIELENKLQNIYKLHVSQKQETLSTFVPSESNRETKDNREQLQKIIKIEWNRRLHQRFRSEVKKMQKDCQQQEEERQMANQMINSIKHDRKKYKNMRQKFQSKIKLYQQEISQKNDKTKDLLFNRKLGSKHVENIFDNTEQQKKLYGNYSGIIKKFLKVNKNDYYQFEKPNSSKLVNLCKQSQQCKTEAFLSSPKKKSFNYVNNYLLESHKLSFIGKRLSF